MMKYGWFIWIAFAALLVTGTASCTRYIPDIPEFTGIPSEDGDSEAGEPEYPGADLDLDDWELVWADEFDGGEQDLDKRWTSQNGPSSNCLSSRWRENAVVSDGTLKLCYRRESRGGQEWTAANLWTKETFLYGYYECRYRYARAYGTNNSFWIRTLEPDLAAGKYGYEIDINEGHYPNEVNTNIHRETADGTQTSGETFPLGASAGYNIPLEMPVTTDRIRFSSNHAAHFHIREFILYGCITGTEYPDPTTYDAGNLPAGLVNYAAEASITVSGGYNDSKPSAMTDGDIDTSYVLNEEGGKWVEFTLPEARTIGCVQFVNGWKNAGVWTDLISDYRIEYHDGTQWVELAAMDIAQELNLADEFHTYGLAWTGQELIYYFDRRELRRSTFLAGYDNPARIWLSGAVVPWAGTIDPEMLDGSCMEVDYVRVYRRRAAADAD